MQWLIRYRLGHTLGGLVTALFAIVLLSSQTARPVSAGARVAADNPHEAAEMAALRAAVDDLSVTFGEDYPRGPEFKRRLGDLWRQLEQARPAEIGQIESRFAQLRREALLAHPLLIRRPILFVARPQYKSDHHNTATMFKTDEINTGSFQGGGAIKTLDLAAGGRITTLIETSEGMVRDPEVYFDGTRILFAIRRNIHDDYHIYEMQADGTGLRQLTFAPGVADIDPLYLPDDRIVFGSTREPKYCMCNRHIMCNLFSMEADGANIQQIGHSTLHEGHP